MRKVLISFSVTMVFLFSLGNGCRCVFKKPEREKISLVQVAEKNLPIFTDDLKGSGLKEAIGLQIAKLKKGDLDQPVKFGEMVITQKRILKTLECFSKSPNLSKSSLFCFNKKKIFAIFSIFLISLIALSVFPGCISIFLDMTVVFWSVSPRYSLLSC
jgi:hypothetical protein